MLARQKSRILIHTSIVTKHVYLNKKNFGLYAQFVDIALWLLIVNSELIQNSFIMCSNWFYTEIET